MSLADAPGFTGYVTAFPGRAVPASEAAAFPALYGLAIQDNLQLSHMSLLEGAAYQSVIYTHPMLKSGAIGGGFYMLNSGKAEARDALGTLTGSFSESQTMGRIGYGSQVVPSVTWGGSLSLINRKLDSLNTGFITSSLGLHYGRIKNVFVDAVFDNISYTSFGDTDDLLPSVFRINIGYTLPSYPLSLGLGTLFKSDMEYGVTAQYSLSDALRIRLGRTEEMSGVGIGLDLADYKLAYTMGMHQLGAIHQVSLSRDFGVPVSKKKETRYEAAAAKARVFVDQGRYSKALGEINNAQRYMDLRPDMQTIKAGLEDISAVDVAEISGGGSGPALLRRGMKYYLDQKYDRAMDVLNQAKTSDPQNKTVQRLSGLAGFVGQPGTTASDGTQNLPKFTEIDPVKLKLFKTEEYFNSQQWDMALKECKEVIELSPNNVTAFIRLGSIFYAIGMHAEATQAWNHAKSISPNDPEVVKMMDFIKQMPKKRK